MEVLVLASGSSGNAALVCSGDTAVLVDVGVSALQVRKRLQAFGRSLADLTAIVLTHEHTDHVQGLEVLVKREPVAVWATQGTWSELPVRNASGGQLYSGRSRRIGSRPRPVRCNGLGRVPDR